MSSIVSKCRPTGLAILNFRQHTAEDDSRSDHPGGVLRLLGVVVERAAEVELPGGVCLDGQWRIRDL